MPRNKINVGDGIPHPSSTNQIVKTLFLVNTGTAGDFNEYDFTQDNIAYFSRSVNQSFEHLLIDNIGDGTVRIAFNRLGLEMSSPVNGSKTLKSGDILYLDDYIRQLSIYYVEDSTVELILMSK
jgi:hypothetical protein